MTPRDDVAAYKAARLTLKQLDTNYKADYAEKLCALYLERCKFRHALAFTQFRKILPDAKLSDLKEMFTDRTEYLNKYWNMVKALQKDYKKGISVPVEPSVKPKMYEKGFGASLLSGVRGKLDKTADEIGLENFDALLNVAMKMEMDLRHKIASFEDLVMINPLNEKKSYKLAKAELRVYDFFTSVYPDSIMEDVTLAVM